MLRLYKKLTSFSGPVLHFMLQSRLQKNKEDAARIHERGGIASIERPEGMLIWIHAASVGEATSALILIEHLPKEAHILVTTGTVTSADLMEKRLPDHAIHQYIPLDHPKWVDLFLDHWKPNLALWMESELWPNMLGTLKERNIPAALINARLSKKSFRRWSYVPSIAADILSSFSMILTQTDQDAAFFKQLGGQSVQVTDNLKYSAAPLPVDQGDLNALQQACNDRPIWVYSSTHQGEEDLACDIHSALKEKIPDLLTVIVPRHPERRHSIIDTIQAYDLTYTLRSHGNLPTQNDDIYLADTLGELGLFYQLSPIAVIGRSFSDDGGGGHNPIEAAQLDCAVVTGAHIQYQEDLFRGLLEYKAAIKVSQEQELEDTLEELLISPALCRTYQNKAKEFSQSKADIINIVMKELQPLLKDIVI